MRIAFKAVVCVSALTSAGSETATTLGAVESEHPDWLASLNPLSRI
jgi:hypothetical protein